MIMINRNIIFVFTTLLFFSACSLSPGMHMSKNSNWLNDESFVYIEELDARIQIENINNDLIANKKLIQNNVYKIGTGDQLAITVWGLQDIFPVFSSASAEQNLRRVDSNGNIFFPYVGIIQAENKTQDQLRADLTAGMSKFFNEPQLDISIAGFNSQKVYLLGEVTTPLKINITDRPLSLADALGEAKGLNTNTSSGSEVFIIRQSNKNDINPSIYRADLSSPSGFLLAGEFYLVNNDIIYVNAKGTTRWNRVISQFFPFSSFLNSIDNLTTD